MAALELGELNIGLREGVIALIALVALYMGYVLLRMRRLRKSPPAVATPAAAPAIPEEPQLAAGNEAVPTDASNAWKQAAAGMAEDVLRQGLEEELAMLRDEVDTLRGELAALRQDMRHELSQMRASQSVSPIYGDAMQLAIAGYDPAAIAERCGIARAEAELVVALAQRREQ